MPTSSDWNIIGALGSIIQAIATVVLLIVAWLQLKSIKDENKLSRTLDVCDRYDLDPILDRSLRDLRSAEDTGLLRTKEADRMHLHASVTTVLNYLDSIAVGIHQGLYIEALVKDHLKVIVIKHVNDYLTDKDVAKSVNIKVDNYRQVIDMAARWGQDPLAFKKN